MWMSNKGWLFINTFTLHIDRHLLGLDPPPLRGANRNLVFHQGDEGISIIKSWRQEGHPTNRRKKIYFTRCRIDKVLGTVQHCLSAVKSMWSFTNCVLMTLDVENDDDHDHCNLFSIWLTSSYHHNLLFMIILVSTPRCLSTSSNSAWSSPRSTVTVLLSLWSALISCTRHIRCVQKRYFNLLMMATLIPIC